MASSTDSSRGSPRDGLSRHDSEDSLPTSPSVLSMDDSKSHIRKTLSPNHLATRLAGLYSEAIGAKLWKVASERLEDGVSYSHNFTGALNMESEKEVLTS